MGWKGWARPPSWPEAGPRSSPGVCWWPRGALRQAGRRAGHPASSRRAGGGLWGESGWGVGAQGQGRVGPPHSPPPTVAPRPTSCPAPRCWGLTSVKAS